LSEFDVHDLKVVAIDSRWYKKYKQTRNAQNGTASGNVPITAIQPVLE